MQEELRYEMEGRVVDTRKREDGPIEMKLEFLGRIGPYEMNGTLTKMIWSRIDGSMYAEGKGSFVTEQGEEGVMETTGTGVCLPDGTTRWLERMSYTSPPDDQAGNRRMILEYVFDMNSGHRVRGKGRAWA